MVLYVLRGQRFPNISPILTSLPTFGILYPNVYFTSHWFRRCNKISQRSPAKCAPPAAYPPTPDQRLHQPPEPSGPRAILHPPSLSIQSISNFHQFYLHSDHGSSPHATSHPSHQHHILRPLQQTNYMPIAALLPHSQFSIQQLDQDTPPHSALQ